MKFQPFIVSHCHCCSHKRGWLFTTEKNKEQTWEWAMREVCEGYISHVVMFMWGSRRRLGLA